MARPLPLAVFQLLNSELLCNLIKWDVYIDDILVYLHSLEEHMTHSAMTYCWAELLFLGLGLLFLLPLLLRLLLIID